MTLIARMNVLELPLLMGDILITSSPDYEGIPQTELPTHLEKYESLSSNSKVNPIDLRQKIYIITDALSLALAGSVLLMKQFLKGAKERFRYVDVTRENVKTFCNEYDKEFLENINYLFIGFTQEGDVYNFFYNKNDKWKGIVHDYFGNCLIAGSGTNTMVKEIISFNNIIDSFTGGKIFDVLSRNMYLAITFLAKERLSLNTIAESWGGGFEIISFDDSKFIKEDDLTYIYYNTEIGDNYEYKNTPFLLINYKYFQDILVITSYDFKNKKKYLVLPLDKQLKDYDLNIIPNSFLFSSRKVACCFLYRKSENESCIVNRLYYDNGGINDDLKITIKETEESIDININKETEDYVFSNIKDFMNNSGFIK